MSLDMTYVGITILPITAPLASKDLFNKKLSYIDSISRVVQRSRAK